MLETWAVWVVLHIFHYSALMMTGGSVGLCEVRQCKNKNEVRRGIDEVLTIYDEMAESSLRCYNV